MAAATNDIAKRQKLQQEQNEVLFVKHLAYYKSFELRRRASSAPLYLFRTLRYYDQPRWFSSKSRKTPPHSNPATVKSQLKKMKQTTLRRRSDRRLKIRMLPLLKTSNDVVAVSVYSCDSSFTFHLLESYCVNFSDHHHHNGAPLDVEFQFDFCHRLHAESLRVVFHILDSCAITGQVFSTEGSCAKKELQRTSRHHESYWPGTYSVHRSHPLLSCRTRDTMELEVWNPHKQEVKRGRFPDLCAPYFELVVSWWPGWTQQQRPRNLVQTTTPLYDALPLRMEWSMIGETQLLKTHRCPICDAFLSSWNGVLTHMFTDHDRFHVRERGQADFLVTFATKKKKKSYSLDNKTKRVTMLESGLGKQSQEDENELDKVRLLEFTDVSPSEVDVMLTWNALLRNSNNNLSDVVAQFVSTSKWSPHDLLLLVSLPLGDDAIDTIKRIVVG